MLKEYINPIDQIINNLREERSRRIKAYNSGSFCDNKTIGRNIEILTKGIVSMNNERVLDVIERRV